MSLIRSPVQYRYVFLGLSITSSWGNGHATTYRSLLRKLADRGHEVTFLERDLPFYAHHRDLPSPPYAQTFLYSSIEELAVEHGARVRNADLVIVGSYVPDGVLVARWVQDVTPDRAAFYDIDTPITLAKLERGENEYLSPDLIPGFSLYLSFTGGPTLNRIATQYGAPCVRPLYCSADPEIYYPEYGKPTLDLGYLGTYSEDRQPNLERLLLEPARRWPAGRFAVAGAQYPSTSAWPPNVTHIPHLAPSRHRQFYSSQRFTLNITREAMARAGWSPSVRLFEAAACGVPIISDTWPGIEEIFEPGKEILVARTPEEALAIMQTTREDARISIANAARSRFLREHTALHRALTLERYTTERELALALKKSGNLRAPISSRRSPHPRIES